MPERITPVEGQINSGSPPQEQRAIDPQTGLRISPSVGGRPMLPNMGPPPEHAIRAIDQHLS